MAVNFSIRVFLVIKILKYLTFNTQYDLHLLVNIASLKVAYSLRHSA